MGGGILGLRRRAYPVESDGAYLDKSFSAALKGLAILLVVLGHYAQMQMEWGVCNRIIRFNALYVSMSLVWFFFISGYGLAASKKDIENYFSATIQRLGKVFLPMALVFVCSIVLYVVLPCKFDATALSRLHIPNELAMLQTYDFSRPLYICLGAVRWYWFVWCILVYYVIFYASEFINKRYLCNIRMGGLVLFAFLAVYYVMARKFLGPSQAHYYRLTWSFLFGVVVARAKILPTWQVVFMTIAGFLTFYFESYNMRESFYIALIVLAMAFYLSRNYIYMGKTLTFLGGVSYMLYLCHRRITWVLLSYIGVNDILAWLLVSLGVAYGFTILYSVLTRNTRFMRQRYLP